MKTIEDIQQEIINEYMSKGDWLDIYQSLIDLGRDIERLDNNLKIDENLLDGCQNKVWITASLNDGYVKYNFDSDSTIVRGIVSLIISVVDNHTPQDIINSDLHFIEDIGLKDQLSYSRGNGLKIIIEKIYSLAKTYILHV